MQVKIRYLDAWCYHALVGRGVMLIAVVRVLAFAIGDLLLRVSGPLVRQMTSNNRPTLIPCSSLRCCTKKKIMVPHRDIGLGDPHMRITYRLGPSFCKKHARRQAAAGHVDGLSRLRSATSHSALDMPHIVESLCETFSNYIFAGCRAMLGIAPSRHARSLLIDDIASCIDAV